MSTPITTALLIILGTALAWALASRHRLAMRLQELTRERQPVMGAVRNQEKDETRASSTEQLQQDLKQSNRRFDLAQKASSDLLYDLEVASGRLQWNDALYAAYGYDRSEPAGTVEWWTAHIHPDDAMKLNEAMDGLARPSTTSWEVAYRLQKADKSYGWVHDRSFVLRNQKGEATHLIGSIRATD